MSQAQILALLDKKAAHMDGAGAEFGGAYIGGRAVKGLRHCVSRRVGPKGKSRCHKYEPGAMGSGCYSCPMGSGYKGELGDTFGQFPVPTDMLTVDGLMKLNDNRRMHGQKPISMRKFLSMSSASRVRAARRLADASRGFHGPASERKAYVDSHLAGSALIGGKYRGGAMMGGAPKKKVKSKMANWSSIYSSFPEGDNIYTCPADYTCYPQWRSWFARRFKAQFGSPATREEISDAWKDFKRESRKS